MKRWNIQLDFREEREEVREGRGRGRRNEGRGRGREKGEKGVRE